MKRSRERLERIRDRNDRITGGFPQLAPNRLKKIKAARERHRLVEDLLDTIFPVKKSEL